MLIQKDPRDLFRDFVVLSTLSPTDPGTLVVEVDTAAKWACEYSRLVIMQERLLSVEHQT